MKTVAVLMVLSLVVALATCQNHGTQQRTQQRRQPMNPLMSMMLMRSLDNLFPMMMLMNGGMGSMMGGSLFPLLAFNTMF